MERLLRPGEPVTVDYVSPRTKATVTVSGTVVDGHYRDMYLRLDTDGSVAGVLQLPHQVITRINGLTVGWEVAPMANTMSCPFHGTQRLAFFGPRTVTLECGAVGYRDTEGLEWFTFPDGHGQRLGVGEQPTPADLSTQYDTKCAGCGADRFTNPVNEGRNVGHRDDCEVYAYMRRHHVGYAEARFGAL